MTTPTTDTTVEPTATMSAAEREQRAQAALTQTRERVTVLGGRLDDIISELAGLETTVREAQDRANAALCRNVAPLKICYASACLLGFQPEQHVCVR